MKQKKLNFQNREKLGLVIGIVVLFIIMSILAGRVFQLVQHPQPAERQFDTSRCGHRHDAGDTAWQD